MRRRRKGLPSSTSAPSRRRSRTPETFGADVAANAGKIADDGERDTTYGIPIADLRDKGKDAMGQAIAIDYMQWMTQPKIQAEYVKPSYRLPANQNVKLDDPRFAIFQQNPEQIFYRHLMYFNNVSQADRPQWGQSFQALPERSGEPR